MSQVTESSNINKASPQLLSMLETVSNPVQEVNLSLDVQGVFAFPQQWKITDDANANMFSYSIQLLGLKLEKGKIQPRQLTQKQIKQAEEAKTKKTAKKDTKIVEQEKKLTPQQEQIQRQKQQQWQSLTEEEKFYRTCQDPFKSPSLKFQKNRDQKIINGQQVNQLRNTIESGEVQIILIKKPQLSQEQIAKLKKSKPKNLNLAQLFKFVFKAKINLNEFLSPGFNQKTLRINIEQQQIPEAAKFQMKDCYILLNIAITPSIVPLITQIKPDIQQLFVLPPKENTNSFDILIQKLKGQIVVGLKGINSQYNNFVTQQKQQQLSKNVKQRQVQKKTIDINERKKKFLSEFLQSGKYKLLKERMQRIISQICIDKIRKQRTIDPAKAQDIQKKLAELGAFFNQQINVIINSFVVQKPEQINEQLVQEYQKFKRRKNCSIARIIQQTQQQKYLRIASQYEIVRNNEKSQTNYQDLILLNAINSQSLYKYILFYLRTKRFENVEILLQRLLHLNNISQYQCLMGLLLLRRRRYKQALKIFAQLIQIDEPNRALYYQLKTIIYRKLGDKKLTVNTRVLAEKMYKLKLGLPVRLDQQQDPYIQTRPKPPKTKPPSLLTPEQTQQFQYYIIETFAKYNLYDMVEELIGKIKESVKKQLLKIEIFTFYEKYSQALKLIKGLLQKDKNNLEFVIIKANICYLSQLLFEAEETYLLAIKLKPTIEQLYQIYLKLGDTYLKRMAWEDSKSVFLKACAMKSNSSLCWFSLGLSHLRLNQIQQAQEALFLSNIYQPLNINTVSTYLNEILSNIINNNNEFVSVANTSLENISQTKIQTI